MILITVGSAMFKFDRLFRIIDELCEENVLDRNEIIAQTGFSQYKSDYYKCVDMVSSDEFINLIDLSDIIICHSGVGTIINGLKHNKKVIVFPRLKEFMEHTDNHQIEIADMFTNEGYIKVAKNKYELKIVLQEIDKFIPKSFVSNNQNINNIIIEFIEGI